MVKWLLQRFLQVVLVLFLVTIASFVLLAALPGSEASDLCFGATATCIHQETIRLGLNHPIIVQYFIWLGHLLSFNFGVSYTSGGGQPITTLLRESYATTVELIIFSQVMAIVVAVPLAMWAALRPNRFFDRVSTTIAFASLSLPPFIVGPILVLLLTAELHVFPGPASAYISFFHDPLGNLKLFFLPSLTLAVGSIAVYQRLLRADMIATLEEDFIVMARAKGLSTARILFRHALRPSTFSLITVGGIQLGGLITGAIIAESVFELHGLGYLLTQGVAQKDYATVQIVTVIVAAGYVVLNFLVDFLYAFIDPRIRRARATS